jgi:hypothetical protein
MESDPTPDNSSDLATHPRLRSSKRSGRDTPFERRIRTLCVFIAAPAFVLAAILLWRAKVSGTMASVLLGVVALLSLLAAGVLMEEIIRPLQTRQPAA